MEYDGDGNGRATVTWEEAMPTLYHITVQGHLDARWSEWFDGLTITNQTNGQTVLSGPIVDQAALHGVLVKIRDLGLPLISVQPAAVDEPGDRAEDHNADSRP